jgi:hypothetical protein
MIALYKWYKVFKVYLSRARENARGIHDHAGGLQIKLFAKASYCPTLRAPFINFGLKVAFVDPAGARVNKGNIKNIVRLITN